LALVGSNFLGNSWVKSRCWRQKCHADRHASSAVRGSGTGDIAKAETLVEVTGGIFGPHAETKAKPAPSGLADQRAHELLANALAARIRFYDTPDKSRKDPASIILSGRYNPQFRQVFSIGLTHSKP
jgi:hypothetical protein